MIAAAFSRSPPRAGFTLLELLVVIAVIATTAGVAFGLLGSADSAIALRSAQATLANALGAARTHAVAKGVKVALLVHDDPRDAERYRRTVALVENVTTAPVVLSIQRLPARVAVFPNRARFAAELREPGTWTGGSSGNALGSTLLDATLALAIGGPVAADWEYCEVTANGTLFGAGSLVVGVVRPRAAGPYPLVFESPEEIRGLTASSYALVRTIDDRKGF